MKKVPSANWALEAGYNTINTDTTTAVNNSFTVTVAKKALTNLMGDFSTAPFTHLYMTIFNTAKTTGTAIKVSGMFHFKLEK
jgi:hypothetical protein